MMIKYKMSYKHKKRLSCSSLSSDETLIPCQTPISPSLQFNKTRGPTFQRVSSCSDSETEDSRSVISTSSSSDSYGHVPELHLTLPKVDGSNSFAVMEETCKLPPMSDICFAPMSARRRLSFETPKLTAYDLRDWSAPPLPRDKMMLALISPRFSPDSIGGPPSNKGNWFPEERTSFPPPLYIPTTEEEEAAKILMAIMNENQNSKGPLLYTPPKRRRSPTAASTEYLFGNLTETINNVSCEDKEPKWKKRKVDESIQGTLKVAVNKSGQNASARKPARLAMADDVKELNSLHCFVRSDLLEVFEMDEHSRKHRDSTPRVGLRCVHCGHLSRKQKEGASMSIFYPKSLQDIYRSVCTWQRIHFKACRHVPPDLVERYDYLKEMDRTRGKKQHWVSSAHRLGLRDLDDNRGGIVWDPDCQQK